MMIDPDRPLAAVSEQSKSSRASSERESVESCPSLLIFSSLRFIDRGAQPAQGWVMKSSSSPMSHSFNVIPSSPFPLRVFPLPRTQRNKEIESKKERERIAARASPTYTYRDLVWTFVWRKKQEKRERERVTNWVDASYPPLNMALLFIDLGHYPHSENMNGTHTCIFAGQRLAGGREGRRRRRFTFGLFSSLIPCTRQWVGPTPCGPKTVELA